MEILVETILSLAGKIKNTNKDKEIAIASLKRNISLLDAHNLTVSLTLLSQNSVMPLTSLSHCWYH
jgi:hypothetical protein